MPYLQHLYCDKCGEPHRLDIDTETTLRAYIDEGRKSVFINQATLVWDYLVYRCSSCNEVFLYTFRDVELKVRAYLSGLSREHESRLAEIVRQNELFSKHKEEMETVVRKRYGKR